MYFYEFWPNYWLANYRSVYSFNDKVYRQLLSFLSLILQVSGHEGSHWSSPPLSLTSDTYDTSLPPHHAHHSLILPPGAGSQNESTSGVYEMEDTSDITGSSNRSHHKYPGYGGGSGNIKLHELPASFQSPFVRSASTEGLGPDQNDPSFVLANLKIQGYSGNHNRHRRRHTTTSRIPYGSLSQHDNYDPYRGYYGYQSPNQMSLSQYSHPGPIRQHLLEGPQDPYYMHRKRGSPASSSDTSSLASDVRHRLASGPGSMSSMFGSVLSTSTTSSSRSSSKGVLPRPPSLPPSSSGSMTSVHPPRSLHPMIPESPTVPYTRSEIQHFPQYPPSSQYDSDHEEESYSTPALPSMKTKPSAVPNRVAPPPPNDVSLLTAKKRRKEKVEHSKIPEEGSRDSLQIKIEMVLSVLSLVNSNTGQQNDADAAKFLLALSRSADTCSVMRQPACMNMLIQIMHNIEHKGDKSHIEVRQRAAETMRNIIESTGETKQGKQELCVLGALEKVRSHCDMLFDMIVSHSNGRFDAAEAEKIQSACDSLLQPIRKLIKYSSDKEKYRPAMLFLGGIQAMAEVLIVNYRLISAQTLTTHAGEKPICHSSKVVTVVISILINLTYGDVNNKSNLCLLPDFLKSLVFHVRQQNESITSSSAQVLRNLSWRASAVVKKALLEHDAAVALVSAIKYVKEEPTLQHITSALWNLSAHSVDSRHKVCSTPNGIQQLVKLLSYSSTSHTTIVVENVGGILKNLSGVIMGEEKYRRKFRAAGGLEKIKKHLKSKNKTVLANATGILWNLSARCPEDQKAFWDLGVIPLLDVHKTSEHKSIAENSRGALRNLLAFGQTNGWTSKSDVMGYNLKTQKGLSKSLCYSANYTFEHSPQQSQNSKHSNESLHSRASQPLPGRSRSSTVAAGGSTASLSQREGRRHDASNYQYPQEDETDFDTVKAKNRLKLARISSAPQASIKKDGLENEWSSYIPYAGSHKHSGSGVSIPTGAVVYQDEPTTSRAKPKRSSKQHGESRGSSIGHPYSLSQSISSSELQSVTGAARLTNEASEATTSLSALESKIVESFDPNQRTHEVYAELDPEEDDENDDIDYPIRRDHDDVTELSSISYPEGYPRSRRSSAMGGAQSQTKGGTSNLALDGKGDVRS